MLTVEELTAAVDVGEIDTVVLAIADMQGRLQGKRFHAPYFLNEVLPHGSEGCNYLLAVDVDMNTVDGYAMSSWQRGYGDFAMVPDPPPCAGCRGSRGPRCCWRISPGSTGARSWPRRGRSCGASSPGWPGTG